MTFEELPVGSMVTLHTAHQPNCVTVQKIPSRPCSLPCDMCGRSEWNAWNGWNEVHVCPKREIVPWNQAPRLNTLDNAACQLEGVRQAVRMAERRLVALSETITNLRNQ